MDRLHSQVVHRWCQGAVGSEGSYGDYKNRLADGTKTKKARKKSLFAAVSGHFARVAIHVSCFQIRDEGEVSRPRVILTFCLCKRCLRAPKSLSAVVCRLGEA